VFQRCLRRRMAETNIRILRKLIQQLLVVTTLLLLAWGATVAADTSQKTETSDAATKGITYEVASLVEELQRVASSIKENASREELNGVRDSLPKEWIVTTPEGNFTISTDFVRGELSSGSAKKAQMSVVELASALSSYSIEQPKNSVNARPELRHILAGPEFGGVGPPSKWDLFRQRLANWVARQLARLFGGIERYPIGGRVLFWVIVVAGVGIAALWIFRFVESRDRIQSLPPGQVVMPLQTWQDWIRRAREAAGRNDFREAVHSTYWAGITRLADLGALPQDPTKTPREYLRLLTEASEDQLLATRTHREPLAKLTTSLERTWYANRGADSNSFRDALQQVEALGCQLE
jgi:hypothetical protein